MNNRKLEFWALCIVLTAFCLGTVLLIIAVLLRIEIAPAVPLVDGTLGTIAMAMWKDFSHSNEAQGDNVNLTPTKPIVASITTIPTEIKP